MSELQEINLSDFTGGLNYWRNQFNLAANESPDMLNMEIDPRRGVYTRRGWSRWNAADATASADWQPRNTYCHQLSSGSYVVYVANDDQIEAAPSTGVFATLEVTGPTAVPATASPHLADFAAWGDYLYIACGVSNAAHRRLTTGTPAAITDAYGNYNDDYTTPDGIGSGAFPKCEFVETHSSYIFAAYTQEGTAQPNRLRWSHPSQPEDWAELDYIDIEVGGGKITGLMSFQDHLLIFKTSSVWALYGYDSDSWQLVNVYTTVGAPTTTAITASENGVYFYSSVSRNGIYGYDGRTGVEPAWLSENISTAVEEITDHNDVWLGWVGKRLWCSLPWLPDNARAGNESSVFVFDPDVGNGAWVLHRAALGHLTCIVEGSDVVSRYPLAAINGDSGAACLVELEKRDDPADVILVVGTPKWRATGPLEADGFKWGDGTVWGAMGSLTEHAFDCYYRTGWQYAGWPERRKSWRRARLIMDQPDETVVVDVDTYFDYNEAAAKRSHTLTVNASGTAFWRATGPLEDGGFKWGDGTKWGQSGDSGSTIARTVQVTQTLSGFGVNRAIQMEFSTNNEYLGRAWGINLITLKYALRRFTT